MYLLKCDKCKKYSLQKYCLCTGQPYPTVSAHPAHFSPEDKYSKHRIILKKRYGLLPYQNPPIEY